MVLELAILNVTPGREPDFEAAFDQARRLISAMPGFVSLELGNNTQIPNRYVLLVRWRTVEEHTQGFRKSQEYIEWSRLLHHFYEPFPTVEYYCDVITIDRPSVPEAER
jgi:heme-degrading monooxygenase HmoA